MTNGVRGAGKVYIGVDGGGTKTLAVLLSADHQVLTEVRGESTNLNAVGREAARQQLTTLIEALLVQGQTEKAQVGGVGLGMSGVSSTAEAQLVTGWVEALLPSVPCSVENDAIMALAAAGAGDLYGIVVVSGTGMIVQGVNRAGERARAGGWGPLIGEPGGGFAIGTAALKAVADAEDGLGKRTMLTEALLAHLNLATPRDLIRWAYAEFKWARFAALARLVNDCASAGDAVSQRILDQSAASLVQAIDAVALRLGFEAAPFPCLFTGGNLTQGLLPDLLQDRLQAVLPTVQVDRRHVNAAVGAAAYCLRQSQINFSQPKGQPS